jgi:hypothetical protein
MTSLMLDFLALKSLRYCLRRDLAREVNADSMAHLSFSTERGIRMRGVSEKIRVPAGMRRAAVRERPRSGVCVSIYHEGSSMSVIESARSSSS